MNAMWHERCLSSWPTEVVHWLKSSGSLTLKLQRCFGEVQVVVNAQKAAVSLSDEYRLLGMSRTGQARCRDVALLVGGRVRVVAHSLVKMCGVRLDWPFWNRLGNRSLGLALFANQKVRLTSRQFSCLPVNHPLTRLTCQVLRRRGQVFSMPFYARRAVYEQVGGATPLMVTEVFVILGNLCNLSAVSE